MDGISIVIPTLNEESNILNLIEDIKNQTLLPNETIVVDGGSQDLTLKLLESESVDTIRSQPPVSKQRTLGAQKAKGEIVIFLDADVRIKTDFIEKLIKDFKKRKLDIACPFYWTGSGTIPVKTFHVFLNIIFYLTQKFFPSGGGPCIIIKKEVFDKEHGFDQKFKFEDLEFISRIGKKYNFGIIPKRIWISDRRFRKYGFIRVFKDYMLVSWYHVRGRLIDANYINYEFGDYPDDD